jgi:predicted DNA-binding transcriptional regulator AlpA
VEPPTYLDMEAVAEYLGLAYKTVRSYHNVAEKRRRENQSRPGDFPPPDAQFGRSPVWSPETIDAWKANRPGRGAGGGRPRKNASQE